MTEDRMAKTGHCKIDLGAGSGIAFIFFQCNLPLLSLRSAPLFLFDTEFILWQDVFQFRNQF
ncbi:hypothetical protein SAMN04489760_10350 [Syntrophus gentianae]|uniref:Uncharacterized protein n=1 Tax=Syntrophus gentianae TaxID=43775 RepID=A0A1H7V5Y6_9BACT|nr:hypothetical protein SAMN04489760_10350 [Syntrophus gentianae]